MMVAAVAAVVVVVAAATARAFTWIAPCEGCLYFSPYGRRCSGGFHDGGDFSITQGPGVWIRAVADGVVTDTVTHCRVGVTRCGGGYGNLIQMRHEEADMGNAMGEAWYTSYNHLTSLLVAKGDRVVQGQVIARMGTTGSSTGVHLHLNWRPWSWTRTKSLNYCTGRSYDGSYRARLHFTGCPGECRAQPISNARIAPAINARADQPPSGTDCFGKDTVRAYGRCSSSCGSGKVTERNLCPNLAGVCCIDPALTPTTAAAVACGCDEGYGGTCTTDNVTPCDGGFVTATDKPAACGSVSTCEQSGHACCLRFRLAAEVQIYRANATPARRTALRALHQYVQELLPIHTATRTAYASFTCTYRRAAAPDCGAPIDLERAAYHAAAGERHQIHAFDQLQAALDQLRGTYRARWVAFMRDYRGAPMARVAVPQLAPPSTYANAGGGDGGDGSSSGGDGGNGSGDGSGDGSGGDGGRFGSGGDGGDGDGRNAPRECACTAAFGGRCINEQQARASGCAGGLIDAAADVGAQCTALGVCADAATLCCVDFTFADELASYATTARNDVQREALIELQRSLSAVEGATLRGVQTFSCLFRNAPVVEGSFCGAAIDIEQAAFYYSRGREVHQRAAFEALQTTIENAGRGSPERAAFVQFVRSYRAPRLGTAPLRDNGALRVDASAAVNAAPGAQYDFGAPDVAPPGVVVLPPTSSDDGGDGGEAAALPVDAVIAIVVVVVVVCCVALVCVVGACVLMRRAGRRDAAAAAAPQHHYYGSRRSMHGASRRSYAGGRNRSRAGSSHGSRRSVRGSSFVGKRAW